MKGLEYFYPSTGDPPGQPLSYRDKVVKVKVGNMSIADWLAMNMSVEGVPRGATKVLVGVAIGENEEVVGCVLLPEPTEVRDSVHEIDWAGRLAIAQKLFEEQNLTEYVC